MNIVSMRNVSSVLYIGSRGATFPTFNRISSFFIRNKNVVKVLVVPVLYTCLIISRSRVTFNFPLECITKIGVYSFLRLVGTRQRIA